MPTASILTQPGVISSAPATPASAPIFFVRNGEDLSAAPVIRRVSDDGGG